MSDRKEKTLAILKALAFILFVIIIPGIIIYLKRDAFSTFNDLEDVENFFQSYGDRSFPIYIGMQIFQVLIAVIPGEIFQIAAGYLYGPLWGFLYSFLGCLIGEIIAFGIARLLGRDFVRLFMKDDQYEKYTAVMNSNKAYTICFILYVIPGIPKDLLCYVAGASEIGFLPFIIMSMVGRIPGLIGTIAMGTLVDSGSYIGALIILIASIIICIIGVIKRDSISEHLDRLREKRNIKK